MTQYLVSRMLAWWAWTQKILACLRCSALAVYLWRTYLKVIGRKASGPIHVFVTAWSRDLEGVDFSLPCLEAYLPS